MRHTVLARLLPATLGLALIAACEAPSDPADVSYGPPLAADGQSQAAIRGLKRLGKGGPMLSGKVERFRIELQDATAESVSWSSNGGAVWSEQALVHWTLPPMPRGELTATVLTTDGEELTATFDFDLLWEGDLEWAVNAAAQGQIDPTPDAVSRCRLAIGPGDVPHVVYRNDTHSQLWYGFFDGTTWQVELVDGPGFDIGGQISSNIAFAVDPSGNPHIAYRYSSNASQIRYAGKTSSTWTRELVNSSLGAYTATQVGISLDPVNGYRPTVMFTYDPGADEEPALAYRTGPNSWTESSFVPGGNDDYFLGGAFNASGTLWVAFDPYALRAVPWTAAGGWGNLETTPSGNYEAIAPVAIDGLGQPIVMGTGSMHHRVGSSWITSAYEATNLTYYDLTTDNTGDPVFAVRHGADLEVGELNSENYWLYTQVDTMDADFPGVAVDSSNITHTCYQKSDSVWFW